MYHKGAYMKYFNLFIILACLITKNIFTMHTDDDYFTHKDQPLAYQPEQEYVPVSSIVHDKTTQTILACLNHEIQTFEQTQIDLQDAITKEEKTIKQIAHELKQHQIQLRAVIKQLQIARQNRENFLNSLNDSASPSRVNSDTDEGTLHIEEASPYPFWSMLKYLKIVE